MQFFRLRLENKSARKIQRRRFWRFSGVGFVSFSNRWSQIAQERRFSAALFERREKIPKNAFETCQTNLNLLFSSPDE